MKRTLSFTLVICFTVLLLSWGASAASGSYRVYKAPEGIVMDGFADDWAVGGLEPTLRVDSNISLIRAGSVARAETTSADLYLLYDEHYFYVFAKVTDDLVMGSASGSGK